jgi:hypothetical protein
MTLQEDFFLFGTLFWPDTDLNFKYFPSSLLYASVS